MRNINVQYITKTVADLVQNTALYVRADVLARLKELETREKTPLARLIMEQLRENARLSQVNRTPCCQDTGIEIIYCQIGQEVHITGGSLEEALQAGVIQGSQAGHLRCSMVADPILRNNTKTNAPAVLHYEIVPGDQLTIACLAKGFGCENKGRVQMFNPTAELPAIKDFILQTISLAGPNACPPFLVGVGMGGTMDKACSLAKSALLLPVGQVNPIKHLAKLEKDLLKAANALKIGPLGFGGETTCLDIKIQSYPCHIAGLPVAVNINCHAVRSQTITL